MTTNLGETYRQLITYDPVLQRVVDALQLPYGPSELRANVTASVIRDTQLIKIAVSDPDPDRAALIANAIATQFMISDLRAAKGFLIMFDGMNAVMPVGPEREYLSERVQFLRTSFAELERELGEADDGEPDADGKASPQSLG